MLLLIAPNQSLTKQTVFKISAKSEKLISEPIKLLSEAQYKLCLREFPGLFKIRKADLLIKLFYLLCRSTMLASNSSKLNSSNPITSLQNQRRITDDFRTIQAY